MFMNTSLRVSFVDCCSNSDAKFATNNIKLLIKMLDYSGTCILPSRFSNVSYCIALFIQVVSSKQIFPKLVKQSMFQRIGLEKVL